MKKTQHWQSRIVTGILTWNIQLGRNGFMCRVWTLDKQQFSRMSSSISTETYTFTETFKLPLHEKPDGVKSDPLSMYMYVRKITYSFVCVTDAPFLMTGTCELLYGQFLFSSWEQLFKSSSTDQCSGQQTQISTVFAVATIYWPTFATTWQTVVPCQTQLATFGVYSGNVLVD